MFIRQRLITDWYVAGNSFVSCLFFVFCFSVLSPVFVCSRLFLWRRRAVRAYALLAAAVLSNLSNPRRPHVQTFCVQIITTIYTLWVVDVL